MIEEKKEGVVFKKHTEQIAQNHHILLESANNLSDQAVNQHLAATIKANSVEPMLEEESK
jgi:uncharacterized protein YaaW (UPF0174 family)